MENHRKSKIKRLRKSGVRARMKVEVSEKSSKGDVDSAISPSIDTNEFTSVK